MKRLSIAHVAVVPVLLTGFVAAAQGQEAATQTVTPPSKITICHKTGADSNPWRRITVSSRGWMNPNSKSGHVVGGHIRHTGDLIVVGTAACPSPTVTPEPTNTPATKLTICHKTGSSTNPYRRITVSSRAWTNPNSPAGKTLRGHARHAGDLLLPGAATCPSGAQSGQGARLSANLQPVSGAAGSGSATVTIRLGLMRLCHTLTVSGLGEVATAAHIHRVSNNAVVVPLTTPTTGTSSGCGTVEKALLQEIVQRPDAFYVNVHTATWANGQVQGKLSR